MSRIARVTLLFFLIALASGCAKKTLVAMAPDPDGKPGIISVETEAGSVTMETPYQATTVGDVKDQPGAPVQLGKEAVEKIFKEALSVQPQRPFHYLLYFKGETTLTSDSAKLLPDIIATIRKRNSIDISVVGHTDTLGSKEFNTALSHDRAKAVKALLVGQGVEGNTIRTTSHGKENPLIPTGDNVYEPKNRRVEVVVR